jgi:hypothetical protein
MWLERSEIMGNLCQCGCGQECQKRFVRGHHNRGKKLGPMKEETKAKLSQALSGENNPAYKDGKSVRRKEEYDISKLCECGCGREIRGDRKYVHGHNSNGKKFGSMKEETKRKISQSTTGEKNHFYGKTHTQEARDNISKKNIEYFKTEIGLERCANQSKVMREIKGDKHYSYLQIGGLLRVGKNGVTIGKTLC